MQNSSFLLSLGPLEWLDYAREWKQVEHETILGTKCVKIILVDSP